jgi:hypothetical protein
MEFLEGHKGAPEGKKTAQNELLKISKEMRQELFRKIV